jgi:uncharacterized protein (DUF1499 family)
MKSYSSSRIGSILLMLAIVAVLSIALMMFGARFDLWQPIVGFGLVRNYMNPIAYVVVGLGVLGFVYHQLIESRCGVIKSSLVTVIGLALLAPMIYGKINPPVRLPPIHDITTDMVTPPAFLVLDDSREGARNTLVYGGSDVAALQKQAYPDIAPIYSTKSAPEAFAEALRVADLMGWELVSLEPEALRFEASARTAIYQFVDDVVVVVTSSTEKTRVDIRSVSRIGRGDRGVNAERVRAFINEFEE